MIDGLGRVGPAVGHRPVRPGEPRRRRCSCGTCAGGSTSSACPPSASSLRFDFRALPGALQAGCGRAGSSSSVPTWIVCLKDPGLRRRRRRQRGRGRRWPASGRATSTSRRRVRSGARAAGGPAPARPGAARLAAAQPLRPRRAAGARRLTVSIRRREEFPMPPTKLAHLVYPDQPAGRDARLVLRGPGGRAWSTRTSTCPS